MKSVQSMRVLSIAVMLMAVFAPAHAGPATPAGEGRAGAHDLFIAIQGTLKTANEAGLLANAQAPWLAVIPQLDSQFETHLQIVAALDLSADKNEPLSLETILTAYRSNGAEEKMIKIIQARVGEIAAAVKSGHRSLAQFNAAFSELAPFSEVSEHAKTLDSLAQAAQALDTARTALAEAERIAQMLRGHEGSSIGEGGGVSGAGRKAPPEEGRLQPHMPAASDATAAAEQPRTVSVQLKDDGLFQSFSEVRKAIREMKSGETIAIESKAENSWDIIEALLAAQARGVKVEWQKKLGFFARLVAPVTEQPVDALIRAKAGELVSIDAGIQRASEIEAVADAAQARGVKVEWRMKKRGFFSSWFMPVDEQTVDVLNRSKPGQSVSLDAKLGTTVAVEAAVVAAQARGVTVNWR